MDSPISEYLESIDNIGAYKTIKVLKSSEYEVTELVETESEPGCDSKRYIRKRIAVDSDTGWIYVRLFEEQLAGRLTYSIPKIHECHVDGTGLAVVMEYIDGHTLSEHVRIQSPSIGLSEEVFPSVCDAVIELHRLEPPVIHRDLKPSNIMVESNSSKIIDLGIARSFKEGAEADTRHLGTPNYAPPEQFGFGQTDTRSDVYALGRLLCFCLTGENPAGSLTSEKLISQGIPEPLVKVILKSTSFDPANRYPSVIRLKDAFLKSLDEMRGNAFFSSNKACEANKDGFGVTAYNELRSKPDTGEDILKNDKAMPSKRLPGFISAVWNVIVGLGWGVLIAACFYAAFEPNEINSEIPLFALVICYPVLLGIFFTALALLLIYKPYFAERFSAVGRLLRPPLKGRMRIFLIVIAVASLVVAVAVYSAFK